VDEQAGGRIVNTELGRRVLDHVAAHRNLFDTSTFGNRDERGTVADLAGRAMLLSGYTLGWQGDYTRPDGTRVELHTYSDEARGLLGLDDEEFYGRDDADHMLFDWQPEETAIAAFRAIVERAEAREEAERGA
jgi:hypothetical protein